MISVSHITKPPKKAPIPPLRDGDRLTVAEFERRYESMPHVKKAELIEGVVHMPSPVRFQSHGAPHISFSAWLATYMAYTPGVEAGDNSTVRLRVGENEPQPDCCLRISEACGGQSRVDEDDYLEGSPEWMGEVSASSAKIDYQKKLPVYEKNGVLEYVIWRVEDEAIDWFVLKRGKYQPQALTKDGLYKSKTFPGLWLDVAAMISGNLAKVIEVVQKGISSPDHKRFVAKLKAKKK